MNRNLALKILIDSEKFLFHITDNSGMEAILKNGCIKPLTIDGERGALGIEEKGTSSFTSDPISCWQEYCFSDKTVVMIFDKDMLISKGVKQCKYVWHVSEHIDDYLYKYIGAEFECEWLSMGEVNIADCYQGFIMYHQ